MVDILIISQGKTELLNDFLNNVNNLHNTIKLNLETQDGNKNLIFFLSNHHYQQQEFPLSSV